MKLAGCVVDIKQRPTRTGAPMAWVRLSDQKGSYEVTFFSEALRACRDVLKPGHAVLVTADLRLEGESLRVTAADAQPLDQAASQVGGALRVWLARTEAVPHIRDVLRKESGGRGRVVLMPRLDEAQDVEISLPGGFNVTPRLAQALMGLPGVERVEEL